jgi:hypothetical protein
MNKIFTIIPNKEDISYFLRGGQSRDTNNQENIIREDVLTNILDIDEEYLNDPEFGILWTNIRDKFRAALNTLCENENFDKITIEHKGGMKYNYDFIVQFLGKLNEETNTRKIIKEVKLEFKHNNTNIFELPQFLELYDKDCKTTYGICETSYSEFFYENYLDEYLKLEEFMSEPKPNKYDYLKNVHDIKYSHPFFKNMFENKKNKTKEKRELASLSINDYLIKYISTFNFEPIIEKIRAQSDKIFLLWDCSNFHIQKIDVNSIQILKIKDISVIEVQKKKYFDLSLTNFDYDLRIRINWGNNVCVANPRWKFTFINK